MPSRQGLTREVFSRRLARPSIPPSRGFFLIALFPVLLFDPFRFCRSHLLLTAVFDPRVGSGCAISSVFHPLAKTRKTK
jgi:hypothetical protein